MPHIPQPPKRKPAAKADPFVEQVNQRFAAVDPPGLRWEADEAWKRYDRTSRMAGSDEERQNLYGKAVKAELACQKAAWDSRKEAA